MYLLKGKIVLVSGASRGIGFAICKKFAEEGAVVFAGVRNLDSLDPLLKKSNEEIGSVIPIPLDVCNADSIKNCITEIKKRNQRLDILINNAGITIIERFDMMSHKSVEKIYNTNVFGLMNLSQFSTKLLRKSSSPCIINMSSILAGDSDIGQTAYASSKAAVESMTKTWAKEYAHLGFRVNAIAPGNVNTDMFNIITEEEKQEAIKKIGLQRLASSEEIANVALFLASDMSSYITGEIINVNGGLIL